jgi:hypothetical protein
MSEERPERAEPSEGFRLAQHLLHFLLGACVRTSATTEERKASNR